MDSQRSRQAARRPVLAVLALSLLTLVGGLAAASRAEQSQSVAEVEKVFADRMRLAADYVTTHLDEMRRRQVDYARSHLNDATISPAQFDMSAAAFGFEAAVLLDSQGAVLAVSPRAPSLLGTRIADRYSHLSAAVDGHQAVSDVVLSAAEQEPVVAVAVPFDTRGGRRVISGGYRLARTPLTRFLETSSPLPGRKLYLVDGAGLVITSTEQQDGSDFALEAPAFDAAPSGASTTVHAGVEHLVVVVPVEGTRWRLVAAVPVAELHGPVSGTKRMLWGLFAATAAMAVLAFVLLTWAWRQRDHLRQISQTDKLTGLANRGRAEDVMARASAVSERTGQPWAVAMIDVDEFKGVNDRLGHVGGDRVLRLIASVLEEQARKSDLCVRWGGDEFLVVLEGTDLTAAAVACERFASAVRKSADGEAVTISVGIASATGGDADTLVGRADQALYRAKKQGRDRVVATPPTQDDASGGSSSQECALIRRR